MKKLMTRRGFTLIEVLVVVLIIGILAAIALPQYQNAIDKSRLMLGVVVVKHIAKAEEMYWIEYGNYTENMNDLNYAIPPSFSKYWECHLNSATSSESHVYCKWKGTELDLQYRLQQTPNTKSGAGLMMCLANESRPIDIRRCKLISKSAPQDYSSLEKFKGRKRFDIM